jgi:predicted CopG family antitoxin
MLRVLVYTRLMKTITLSEEAYSRLREWKMSSRDSFSKVVLTVVPARGTLGQAADEIAQFPPLSSEHAKVMEEAAQRGRDPASHDDPWTT